MPNAVQYARLKAAGLCTRCGKNPLFSSDMCKPCYVAHDSGEAKRRRNSRISRRIYARIGVMHRYPEWKIREIEEGRKIAEENPLVLQKV